MNKLYLYGFRFFFIPFFLAAASVLYSGGEMPPRFSWPLTRGVFPDLQGLTSTFGESRVDHFHNGLDISAIHTAVHPVAAGKLLYTRESSFDPFFPEPGAGNYVFLDHGNGWWSGYYHLDKIRPAWSPPTVSVEDSIGMAGNTGHSSGGHLHFFIIKEYGKIYVNPLNVLPEPTDRNAPVIGQLVIVTPSGTTLISHSRAEAIRLTKLYPVQIKVIDQGLEKNSRRGIYKLSWKLNRQEPQSLTFSSLRLSERGWRLPGGQTFDESFQNGIYNLGTLNFVDGDNTLTVTATDHAANETTVTFTIHVTK